MKKILKALDVFIRLAAIIVVLPILIKELRK